MYSCAVRVVFPTKAIFGSLIQGVCSSFNNGIREATCVQSRGVRPPGSVTASAHVSGVDGQLLRGEVGGPSHSKHPPHKQVVFISVLKDELEV